MTAMGHPTAEPPASDPQGYSRRLQADVEMEARRIRRERPGLEQLEAEIERAWMAAAPVLAGVEDSDELLSAAERYAHTEVDAPCGARRGVRQVKQVVRKLTYWYLRHLSDQVNIWNNAAVRWMRRAEQRLRVLEAAQSPRAAHDSWHELLVIADMEESVAEMAATAMAEASGTVAVLGCGEGAALRELAASGVAAYGIDPDPRRIAEGVDAGLDLRPCGILEHLVALPDGSLGGVVIAGAAASLPLPATVAVAAQSARVTASGGIILVVAAVPHRLAVHERELRAGRGVQAETWLHLLVRAGCDREPGLVERCGAYAVMSTARR